MNRVGQPAYMRAQQRTRIQAQRKLLAKKTIMMNGISTKGMSIEQKVMKNLGYDYSKLFAEMQKHKRNNFKGITKQSMEEEFELKNQIQTLQRQLKAQLQKNTNQLKVKKPQKRQEEDEISIEKKVKYKKRKKKAFKTPKPKQVEKTKMDIE